MATKNKGRAKRKKGDWIALSKGRSNAARTHRTQGRCPMCHHLIALSSLGEHLGKGGCTPKRPKLGRKG